MTLKSLLARGRYGFQQERDALIGAFIKIREGVYKGHKGRVKNIKGKNVQVELEAQMRVVLGKFFDELSNLLF